MVRGNVLALGAVATLAAAGLARKRGAANATGWPETVPQFLRMRAEELAEIYERTGGPIPKNLGTWLGEGMTRVVFALDDDFVVKVPRAEPDHPGFNQNEADTWAKASKDLRALLVPVLEADPGGKWLIMPRVRTRLKDDEYARAKRLCAAVEREVTVRYSDCEEGQNVGARADGQLFVFDYPFDPDDVPEDESRFEGPPRPVTIGSRATTPLPASFPPTEIGLLTRSAFLDLRNPGEKFHPETAYDFDLAKMNRPRLDLHATHRDSADVFERGDATTLWIPSRAYGTPVPDPVREAILRDDTGTLAVLHDGVLHHAHRVRPQDVPRTWWSHRARLDRARRRLGNAREEPTQLGIDRAQVVKYPEPLEKLVSDVTVLNRAAYDHLLQRIVVKGSRYELRSAGVPVPDRGTSLAILDAAGQKVAEATDEWGATLVVVAKELRGKGLGPILTRAWYDLNPRYRSGGFTSAGRGNAVRTWEARVREFMDRGWYSELVKQGRMTAAEVKTIQAGLSGKRAPSPLPVDLPKTGPTPGGHQLLAYVDGPTFVLYDSRFLVDPDEQWIRGYGFFRDADVRGTRQTFLYRIEYESTHRVQATLAALQLARDEGWPVYVGPGYGDLVELDGIEDRVVREGERVRLRVDALPLRDMAKLEARVRSRNDPYREMESRLLEAAEGKWV